MCSVCVVGLCIVCSSDAFARRRPWRPQTLHPRTNSHTENNTTLKNKQTRFHLPVWLGIDAALGGAIADGQLATLQEMYDQW